MARPGKPWFWTEKDAWYANINGKRIRLAEHKEEASRQFHKLKSEAPKLRNESLLILVDDLLSWTLKNRRAGTYRFYQEHAQRFIDFLNEKKKSGIQCDELSVDLCEDYLETLSAGRRNGAVQMIKRAYNWGIKRGRITGNPILALEKPSLGRRKNIVPDKHFALMLKSSDQNLKDLLTFCWEMGARPQEAWRIKPEFVEEKYKRCVLPNDLTKRKKGDRHIYCNHTAWKIVTRLKKNASDYLFVNQAGTQWNKDNIGKRMEVLSKVTGKRYALYDLRHTRITKMVKAGMDTHLVAKLVGTSILMIEKHYDHSDEDAKFMLDAVQGQQRQRRTPVQKR